MFRGLRVRLTLLYLLAALALIVLVGGGAYGLLNYYFQTTTDRALQIKMAQGFRSLGAPLPAELTLVDSGRSAGLDRALPTATALPGVGGSSEGENEGRSTSGDSRSTDSGEDSYDSELAGIFVLPLSSQGVLLFDPNAYAPPRIPDSQAAVDTALAQGSDLRTVTLNGGTRVRLLTYRLGRSDGPAVLQVGRTLTDQDRVLRQLLAALVGLGGISAALLGLGSWWLAGRSLQPTQQAWEKQQAFVANASHELRTPLTLMRASAEVALRSLPGEDVDRRTLIGDVMRECDHMSRLVEDLLLLSRLDAGRLTLERKVIPMADSLADVQRQVGRLADERGVRLTADGAGAVWGDPARVRQVLLALLDNALKHTPAGGTIHVEAQPQGKQVHITVEDTGSGIAPEHQTRVFERFYQVDGARSQDKSGSGLGLTIAQALVEAQGGLIRVESQVGQGTRVTVLLPRAGD